MTASLSSRRRTLTRLGAIGVAAVGVAGHPRAYAAVYLQRDDALKLLLPSATSIAAVLIVWSSATLESIAAASGARVPRSFAPDCFVGRSAGDLAGWVCFDRVIGKYELIDYAVGFDRSGSVTGVEIVAYHESHGAEIRNAAWRRQFTGRKGPAEIRFGDDIRNITGATLSCQHVTDGVRLLSAVHATLLAPLETR